MQPDGLDSDCSLEFSGRSGLQFDQNTLFHNGLEVLPAMNGLPVTAHGWIREPRDTHSNSSGWKVAGSHLSVFNSVTTPLSSENLSWRVKRVEVCEQRIDEPVSAPESAPHGNGIAYHKTEVLDSSFSEDSIDEIEAEPRKMLVPILKNAFPLANNDSDFSHADEVHVSMKRTNSQSPENRSSQTKKFQSESTSNSRASRQEYLSLDFREDEASIEVCSGTSTPVKVWHEPELVSPRNSAGGQIAFQSQSNVGLEFASDKKGRLLTIPSVSSLPQLCQSSGRNTKLHFEEKAKDPRTLIPAGRFTNEKTKKERYQHLPQRRADLDFERHVGEVCIRVTDVHAASFANVQTEDITHTGGFQDALKSTAVFQGSQTRTTHVQNSLNSTTLQDEFGDSRDSGIDHRDSSTPNPLQPAAPPANKGKDATDAPLIAASGNEQEQLSELRLQLQMSESLRIAERREQAWATLDIIAEIRKAQDDAFCLQELLLDILHRNDGESNADGGSDGQRFANQSQLELSEARLHLHGKCVVGENEQDQTSSQKDQLSSVPTEDSVKNMHIHRNKEDTQYTPPLHRAGRSRRDSVAAETHALNIKALTVSGRRDASCDKQQELDTFSACRIALQQALGSRHAAEQKLRAESEKCTKDLKSIQEMVISHLVQLICGLEEVQNEYIFFEQELADAEESNALTVSTLESRCESMKLHLAAVENDFNRNLRFLQNDKIQNESKLQADIGKLKRTYGQSIAELEQNLRLRDQYLHQEQILGESRNAQLVREISKLERDLQISKAIHVPLKVVCGELCELASNLCSEGLLLGQILISKHSFCKMKLELNIILRTKCFFWRRWVANSIYFQRLNSIKMKVLKKNEKEKLKKSTKVWSAVVKRKVKSRRKIQSFANKNAAITMSRSLLKWRSDSEASEKQRVQNSCADIVQRMRDRQHFFVSAGGQNHLDNSGESSPASNQQLGPGTVSTAMQLTKRSFSNQEDWAESRTKSTVFSNSELQTILSKYGQYSLPKQGYVMEGDSSKLPNKVLPPSTTERGISPQKNYSNTSPIPCARSTDCRIPHMSQGTVETDLYVKDEILSRLNHRNITRKGDFTLHNAPGHATPFFKEKKIECENIWPWNRIRSSRTLSYRDFSFNTTEPPFRNPFSSLSPQAKALLRSHSAKSGRIDDIAQIYSTGSHSFEQGHPLLTDGRFFVPRRPATVLDGNWQQYE